MHNYLSQINTPDDLKKLSLPALSALAEEIRAVLIQRIGVTGGHMGSNLGFIEPTIAMHYVFDAPRDKIVYDVSHQSYTHKILTGRKAAFTDPAQYHSVSGYTNPEESPYDLFQVGHTATSVSLATGLAKARDLTGGKENVIAVIGDGSLSGGEAMEGLNNAAALNSNFILVFNDNEMSIAPNQGGMYRNLALLRETNGTADCNLFRAFGMDYLYVADGNDMQALVAAFQKAKDTDHPIVLHLHTLKGKGLPLAEEKKEKWHWALPGELEHPVDPVSVPQGYDALTADYLLQKCKTDPAVAVLTAATPGATGLTPAFRAAAGSQFIDVGIAEEHAVAMASGMAAAGGKPVLEILSSFLQRTYDQLSQDLALNQNSATILVFGSGLGGDATHLGSFDLSLVGNIPNLICLAPTTKEEYFAMLDWSIEQNSHAVILRVPETVIESGKSFAFTDENIKQYCTTVQGSRVAVLALGDFFPLGKAVQQELLETAGIQATLVEPRCYSHLDSAMLESLKAEHQLIVTLENGVLDGGFGEKIARYYGSSSMRVLTFGGKKEFTDRVPEERLRHRYHLTPKQITDAVIQALHWAK